MVVVWLGMGEVLRGQSTAPVAKVTSCSPQLPGPVGSL